MSAVVAWPIVTRAGLLALAAEILSSSWTTVNVMDAKRELITLLIAFKIHLTRTIHSPCTSRAHNQSREKQPEPSTFRVRIGAGVVDSDARPSIPRTPRGSVRYTGATFNHTLVIDSTTFPVFGPFVVCEGTLTQVRTEAKQHIELYKFADAKARQPSGDPDLAIQEITRYADTRELMEEFEALLEEEGFSLSAVASNDDHCLYLLALAEFQVLQATDRKQTWLYHTSDIRSPLIDTENATEDTERRAYVYDHFNYIWLEDDNKGESSFIIYFQSSTAAVINPSTLLPPLELLLNISYANQIVMRSSKMGAASGIEMGRRDQWEWDSGNPRLSSANALGPVASGGTTQWAKRRAKSSTRWAPAASGKGVRGGLPRASISKKASRQRKGPVPAEKAALANGWGLGDSRSADDGA
ncbi:hypothetical protein B0H17DRAFT_1130375 [Mycena rosella]|uniref:MINDY deubiquitinase domain-containing protein n=1 Tax=Mycena rosella TaxID=1033263 RepID=A0AAD7DQK7_MYCRO|nr:hypothetical protein B0H17DRAFT_1130375 [Mycena rosella]